MSEDVCTYTPINTGFSSNVRWKAQRRVKLDLDPYSFMRAVFGQNGDVGEINRLRF